MLGLNVTIEYHEQPSDGSLCSVCEQPIVKSMYTLYLSVNTGDELGFDLIPSKYKLCEPCKLKEDK